MPAPLIRVLGCCFSVFTGPSLITNPQNHLLFLLLWCVRWGHQPVCARGAAGVHRRQRAFGRRDGRGLGVRGQAGGHPAQPGVLRTPQRRAMRSTVGHHLQRPSLHQGEPELTRPHSKSRCSYVRERGQMVRISGGVINALHLSWENTELWAELCMESLSRRSSGACLSCQDAQCNHFVFLVSAHSAGVIYLSYKYIW